MIKPIETIYNGYRFRSRLEARWAVFFDALGITYEYEPDGYEIDDERYLPDFYLLGIGIHVEVKGRYEGYETAIVRIRDFIRWGGPIKSVLILSDVPFIQETEWNNPFFPIYYYDQMESGHVACGWVEFADNPIETTFVKQFDPPSIMPSDISKGTFSIDWKSPSELIRHSSQLPCSSEKIFSNERIKSQMTCSQSLLDAFKMARQARFEHGETPQATRRQVGNSMVFDWSLDND